MAGTARHNKGCNCKKSGCLKKYCECFQAGIYCGDNCKCIDCKNFEVRAVLAQCLQVFVPQPAVQKLWCNRNAWGLTQHAFCASGRGSASYFANCLYQLAWPLQLDFPCIL